MYEKEELTGILLYVATNMPVKIQGLFTNSFVDQICGLPGGVVSYVSKGRTGRSNINFD